MATSLPEVAILRGATSRLAEASLQAEATRQGVTSLVRAFLREEVIHLETRVCHHSAVSRATPLWEQGVRKDQDTVLRVAHRMLLLKVEAQARATGRHQAGQWAGSRRREATGLPGTAPARDTNPEATVRLLRVVATVERPTAVHSREDPDPERTGKPGATEDRALVTAQRRVVQQVLWDALVHHVEP